MNWIDELIEQGRQLGRAEARQEAHKEGAIMFLMNVLFPRSGPGGIRTQKRLEKLSFEERRQLNLAALDFCSRKDLMKWLKEHKV